MTVSPARRNGPFPGTGSNDRLAVATRPTRGGLVLALSGELDVADTGTLNSHVDTAIARGLSRLVLDLRDLEFCDCAGLGALLRARRLTAAQQGWARLACVPPRISRIIGVVGLHGALACYPSIRHAFDDAPEPAPAPALRSPGTARAKTA